MTGSKDESQAAQENKNSPAKQENTPQQSGEKKAKLKQPHQATNDLKSMLFLIVFHLVTQALNRLSLRRPSKATYIEAQTDETPCKRKDEPMGKRARTYQILSISIVVLSVLPIGLDIWYIVQPYSDEKVVQLCSDGKVVQLCSDGKVVQPYSDEEVVQLCSDGKVVQLCSDEKDFSGALFIGGILLFCSGMFLSRAFWMNKMHERGYQITNNPDDYALERTTGFAWTILVLMAVHGVCTGTLPGEGSLATVQKWIVALALWTPIVSIVGSSWGKLKAKKPNGDKIIWPHGLLDNCFWSRLLRRNKGSK